MLPQYLAFSVSLVSFVSQFRVSVRWVTLWVRPPLCVSVRWVTLWVHPPLCVSVCWVTLWVRPHPFENMCVRSLGYIVGASPPRVCPFIGRQSLLDPCMLPTLLCGIFRSDFYNVKNRICSLSYNLSSCLDIHQLDSQNCRG